MQLSRACGHGPPRQTAAIRCRSARRGPPSSPPTNSHPRRRSVHLTHAPPEAAPPATTHPSRPSGCPRARSRAPNHPQRVLPQTPCAQFAIELRATDPADASIVARDALSPATPISEPCVRSACRVEAMRAEQRRPHATPCELAHARPTSPPTLPPTLTAPSSDGCVFVAARVVMARGGTTAASGEPQRGVGFIHAQRPLPAHTTQVAAHTTFCRWLHFSERMQFACLPFAVKRYKFVVN